MRLIFTLVLLAVLCAPAQAFPQKIYIEDAAGLREAKVVPKPSFKERHPRWYKFGKYGYLTFKELVILGGGVAQWVTAGRVN